MQQVALTALAVQASPEDIRELKTLFLELDVNGDGSLTIEELAKGLQESQNG
jgi:Ca2+-binding EF-hand superfamily protein